MISALTRFPLSLGPPCLSSIDPTSLNLHPIALGLATLLAAHGYRKGSLSTSGAIAAFLIGYLTMANPFPLFGTMMIVFYLAGSRVTKIKADVKATLERESTSDADAKHKSEKGGGRDMWQVLCNGLTGCVAAVFFRLLHSNELPRACQAQSFHILSTNFISPYNWKGGNAHCAIDPAIHSGWSRFAAMLALGHFACCAGDVFASELGILSKSKPVLLTSFPPRTVPPGTNGGVSVLGTVASGLGGILIGIVFLATTLVWNAACAQRGAMTVLGIYYIAVLSTVAGVLGSGVSARSRR